MPNTIKEEVSIEITEKKSRFIATICYVQSKEEAERKLEEIQKKYSNANHNCFAFRIMENENNTIERYSDDGEPKGTAGIPILTVLNKNELVNILAVVTRYFGGILLGTGGLVRAYSEATIQALEKAQLVEEIRGYEIEIVIGYQDLELLQYYCRKKNIKMQILAYEEKIRCMLEVSKSEKEEWMQKKEEIKFRIESYSVGKEKNIRKSMNV